MSLSPKNRNTLFGCSIPVDSQTYRFWPMKVGWVLLAVTGRRALNTEKLTSAKNCIRPRQDPPRRMA